MQTDTIKALFTYVIALVIIVGGFIFLYATQGNTDQLLAGAVIGFIGSAIQFVFNRETQTQTARQVERSTAAGAGTTPAEPQP